MGSIHANLFFLKQEVHDITVLHAELVAAVLNTSIGHSYVCPLGNLISGVGN